MKLIKGTNKLKISKKEWENLGKKAGWVNNNEENKENVVTIWDFLDDWDRGGYGIALISPDDKVVDPYIVDGSDYPDMILNKSGSGAKVIDGKYKGYYIVFHSGQLEEKVGEEWFPDSIKK